MAGGRKHFLVFLYVFCLCSFVRASNVALRKTATLSSLAPHWNRAASLAVDGNTNTDFYSGGCVATAEETDPWLRVDLGRLYMVKSVKIYLMSTDLFYVYLDQVEYPESGVDLGSDKTFDECLDLCRKDTANNCRDFVRRNRQKDNCWRVTTGRKYQKDDTYTQNKGRSLANLQIRISETDKDAETVCHVETRPVRSNSSVGYSVNYACGQPVPGRYVTLKVSGNARILSLCEVQVYGVILTLSSGPVTESVTSDGFTIRWGSCQHAENGVYRLEYRKKHADEWTTKNVTSGRAVVTDLLRNTEYNVRVSCYWKDSSGLLRLIPGVHKEIVVKTLCTVPGNVIITEVTPTMTGDKSNPQANIRLAWQYITDSGCDKIESYAVQYKVAGSKDWLSSAPHSMDFSTLGIKYTLRGLQSHATYSVRVGAKNNDQKWSQSEVREVKTKEGWSSPVQSLQHVARSDSLTLTWQTPVHSRGVIAGYKVSYQLRKRSTCSYVHEKWADDVMVTSLSYDLIGLHPYSEYNVRVVPVNGAGDGVDQTINARTVATEPTSSPSVFIFKSKTSKSLTLGWTAADCNGMNGVFRHYKATLKGIEHDSRTMTNTTRDVTWTVDGLVPHALYSFTVTTVNNVGSSGLDFFVSVRTNEATPRPPTDVHVSVSRLDALVINWTTAAPPHGVVLNYEVRFWVTNHGESTNVSITRAQGNETGVHLHSLEHHSNYSIEVRGRTVIGWGEWSTATYAFTEVDKVSDRETPVPPGGRFVEIIAAVPAAVVVCLIIGVIVGVVIYRRRKSPPNLANVDRRNDQRSQSKDRKLQDNFDDKEGAKVVCNVGEGYENLQGFEFSKDEKDVYEEIKEGRL